MSLGRRIYDVSPFVVIIPICVFDVSGLSTTSKDEIQTECSTSYLWHYVCASLFFMCINPMPCPTPYTNTSDLYIDSGIVTMSDIVYFFNIVLFLIGSYQMFCIECNDEFSDTLLYRMGIFHLCLHCFSTLFFCIRILVGSIEKDIEIKCEFSIVVHDI